MAKRDPAWCSLARRDVMKAIAAGAGVAFLPTFGLSRFARADVRSDAPARNALVLNCVGAMRSSAGFFASAKARYNPYGVVQTSGMPFPVGRFLGDRMAELGEGPPASYALASWNNLTMPSLESLAIAGGFSVMGTWDPGSGDHVSDRIATTTGDRSGAGGGLLTRIYAGLADAHASHADFPAFHIDDQGATFGKPGGLARYVPVTLSGPGGLPGAGDGAIDMGAVRSMTGNDWAADDTMRGRLDQALAAKRAQSNRNLADVFALHRAAAHSIGGTLAQSFVNVANADPAARAASFGTVNLGNGPVPLTNQMLWDAFTNALATPDPTSHPLYATAMNAAISVRLLQLGSRAVAINVSNFDSHSGERDFRPVYQFTGRLWGALAFVLSRVADPVAQGKSLLDTTFISTMSEFGRDPGGAAGYNGGGGCDHGSDTSTWYQAHAVMGCGIKGGRVVGGVDTDTYRGDLAQERYDARGFLATILWALGLDQTNPDYGFEDVTKVAGLWS